MKSHKDPLNKFIMENKDSFDEHFNTEEVWQNIAPRIKKKNSFKFNWYAAASVALLFAVAYLLYDNITMTKKVDMLTEITIEGRKYNEIEAYYTNTINSKVKLIKNQSQTVDYPIEEGITQLQQKYEELKVKLKEEGPHEKIVNAMVLNLKMQLNILNNQLMILEQVQEFTTEKEQNYENI